MERKTLYGNSINTHLLIIFLHAEFISAMKTRFSKKIKIIENQNPKLLSFHENAKIIEIVPFIIHFCFILFEIFTETLEQIVTKSHKILILDGKEDK